MAMGRHHRPSQPTEFQAPSGLAPATAIWSSPADPLSKAPRVVMPLAASGGLRAATRSQTNVSAPLLSPPAAMLQPGAIASIRYSHSPSPEREASPASAPILQTGGHRSVAEALGTPRRQARETCAAAPMLLTGTDQAHASSPDLVAALRCSSLTSAGGQAQAAALRRAPSTRHLRSASPDTGSAVSSTAPPPGDLGSSTSSTAVALPASTAVALPAPTFVAKVAPPSILGRLEQARRDLVSRAEEVAFLEASLDSARRKAGCSSAASTAEEMVAAASKPLVCDGGTPPRTPRGSPPAPRQARTVTPTMHRLSSSALTGHGHGCCAPSPPAGAMGIRCASVTSTAPIQQAALTSGPQPMLGPCLLRKASSPPVVRKLSSQVQNGAAVQSSPALWQYRSHPHLPHTLGSHGQDRRAASPVVVRSATGPVASYSCPAAMACPVAESSLGATQLVDRTSLRRSPSPSSRAVIPSSHSMAPAGGLISAVPKAPSTSSDRSPRASRASIASAGDTAAAGGCVGTASSVDKSGLSAVDSASYPVALLINHLVEEVLRNEQQDAAQQAPETVNPDWEASGPVAQQKLSALLAAAKPESADSCMRMECASTACSEADGRDMNSEDRDIIQNLQGQEAWQRLAGVVKDTCKNCNLPSSFTMQLLAALHVTFALRDPQSFQDPRSGSSDSSEDPQAGRTRVPDASILPGPLTQPLSVAPSGSGLQRRSKARASTLEYVPEAGALPGCDRLGQPSSSRTQTDSTLSSVRWRSPQQRNSQAQATDGQPLPPADVQYAPVSGRSGSDDSAALPHLHSPREKVQRRASVEKSGTTSSKIGLEQRNKSRRQRPH
mmetsp:Transcript_49696/g.118408  ORF Transcript_49696/g.118408 Transcript_49696/m.118408 type:complete len:839 (+) Transcript_49696:161-2677(+)